jgi:hypothetical protein
MATSAKREMTAEHKAALAEGREQGRRIRAYLEAVEAHKPSPGRKRTPEAITSRLAKIDAEIPAVDPLQRVLLVQERLDLRAEQAASAQANDLAELEAAFVEAVGPYSQRKGISYAAWREVGVSAAILKRAGLSRSTG